MMDIGQAKKIYIVGSVASGKTMMAWELSRRLGILCYELDNIVWERRPAGDVKRTPKQRDELFDQITLSEKWIIEDVMRPCFDKGLKRADIILLLDTPRRRRSLFAVFRWIKQKIRMERANTKPTVSMLKSTFRWSGDFERNRSDFMKRLKPYENKVIVIKDMGELERLLPQ